MPRPVRYKRDSIIYFQGDVSDKVFVLKEGRLSMTFRDIETGKELQELIQTGEFFGVKSALGRYPREENVVAVSDCIVLVFTVQEFEEFASRNTRVIMKMLKVFSTQLRRIHTKVRTLLALDVQLDPEQGLIRTGDYFRNKRRTGQALYAYHRYVELYPDGRYVDHALEGIDACKHYSGRDSSVAAAAEPASSRRETEMKGDAKRYYEALSLFGQQKYEDAMTIFSDLAKNSLESEYRNGSIIEVGRCLHYLGRYKEAVKHLSGAVQQNPNLPDIEKALFYIARSYAELGSTDRAKAFYQRILSLPGIEAEYKNKVNSALRKLEGKL